MPRPVSTSVESIDRPGAGEGMHSGDPVPGSEGMNLAAEGMNSASEIMDSWGENPVGRSQRISEKRTQTGVVAVPLRKRRGGRQSLKDDAETWSELAHDSYGGTQGEEFFETLLSFSQGLLLVF